MKDEVELSSNVNAELKPLTPIAPASFSVAKTASVGSLALATVAAAIALPLTVVEPANAKVPEQVTQPEFKRVYQSNCLDNPDGGDPADWSKHDNFDMTADSIHPDPGAPGLDSIDSTDSSSDGGGGDGGGDGGGGGGDYGW